MPCQGLPGNRSRSGSFPYVSRSSSLCSHQSASSAQQRRNPDALDAGDERKNGQTAGDGQRTGGTVVFGTLWTVCSLQRQCTRCGRGVG